MFETDIGEDGEHSASFAYISVPQYALREWRLSMRARSWTPTKAKIQSCKRTAGGYKETIRIEVWYSYEMNGNYYSGRILRDRVFGGVQRIASQYPPGADVLVKVDPADSAESYLPSGIGYVEPFIVGFVTLGFIATLVFLLVMIIEAVIEQIQH